MNRKTFRMDEYTEDLIEQLCASYNMKRAAVVRLALLKLAKADGLVRDAPRRESAVRAPGRPTRGEMVQTPIN